MRFMREQEYRESLLSQALCDGLKEMIYQYYQQVTQLDEKQGQGGVSLQTMWVEVQDALKVLRALGELVTAAGALRGGQLLSCLLRLLADTTDRHVLLIYKHLSAKLTRHYLRMLARWIYEGKLDDRHGEFMVCNDERGGQWNNWEEKFLLRTEMVPSMLERDAQTILVTGKYINILRACNRDAVCPFAGELEAASEQGGRFGFTEPIQRAYEWAN
jgi:gamma-tubulin complex component 2